MILQALTGYYERLAEKGEVTKPGWGSAKVSYGLELDCDGNLLGTVPLKLQNEKGKWIPQIIKVPEPVTRSSGVSANFLCDNSGYLLGIDNKGNADRSLQCFEAAKKKHLQILEFCDSAPARAVKLFFESWNPEQVLNNCKLQENLEDIISGVNLVFLYEGKYVQQDEDVMMHWENSYNQSSDENQGICLVTGKRDAIARIHTGIKGIPGAQSSGAALVSFNAPAFESYGKEQSYNAPVGERAVFAYTTALNYLVSDRAHRTLLGDTMIIYWAESGESEYQDIFSAMMDPGTGRDVQETLDGIFKNLARGASIDLEAAKNISFNERFYILALSPNAARLSVRFFYQDTFGNILEHIGQHYERMKIIKPFGDQSGYMGVWRMIQETVNKKSKDKKPVPNMAASVYRAILSGDRYPEALFSSVLNRIRAEQDDKDRRIQKITPGRAAIIKAYLIHNYKGDVSVELNENNTNIAYVLGREFAVLEAIQEAANPGINSTIKDRYFNSACAAPAMIFPILFRLKNSHIKKINNIGQTVKFEQALTALQAKITVTDEQSEAYPKRLSLEEQGMFILGYYHQVQKRYEKKEEK